MIEIEEASSNPTNSKYFIEPATNLRQFEGSGSNSQNNPYSGENFDIDGSGNKLKVEINQQQQVKH